MGLIKSSCVWTVLTKVSVWCAFPTSYILFPHFFGGNCANSISFLHKKKGKMHLNFVIPHLQQHSHLQSNVLIEGATSSTAIFYRQLDK